jgi:diguanylate cyclase (GGDEF)-like protein
MGEHRAWLGAALIGRADDVAEAVLERVWPAGTHDVDPVAVEAIARADRAGTRMMGLWLTGGDKINEEDRRRLGALGEMVDRLPLGELIKAYLAWRDVLLAVLDEEAARLGTPPELVAEVAYVISRNNDGSIVRMARRFDEERRRLHEELDVERAKLAEQACHDALTGLPNRVLLFDRMQHALHVSRRGARELALLFVDLDGFKLVNDRMGHRAGDEVLVAVAERLSELLREADTVARIGGDEFIVLCEDIDTVQRPVEIARRIIAELKRPFSLSSGSAVSISASVGIAHANGTDGPDDLLVRADAAMYAAKQRGPGGHELAVVPKLLEPAAS